MEKKAKGKLFLFHWEKTGATARAAELTAEGWAVEVEFEEGSRGSKNLKAFGPDIVVLDLAKRPSHSRECGRALRNAKAFRATPFIFVDGSDEDISKTKEKVTSPIFTTSGALKKVLARHAR
jgi:DNA-binding response OmpR family regulator